jgi:protein-tyrosine sulfotransferase
MPDPHRGARFIFVGGAARSGTTLVQNILDSHPDICGAPEFHHIPDIVSLRKRLHNSIANEWIDLICSYDDVDHRLSSLIENLLLPLADKCGCRFLSEKTPNNVLVFAELLDLFPAARFIQVIRDPRAVIASMLQVGRRAKQASWTTPAHTHSVVAAIAYIKQCLHRGFASQKIAPDRVVTVAYEKLVSEPESETRRICNFLKVDWCQKMLHPGSLRHLGEKAVTNNVWYDTQSYNRDPKTDEIDKWRTQLTYVQQVMIATAFRDHGDLSQFGYDFALNSPLGFTLQGCLRFAGHVRRRSLAGVRQSRLKVRRGMTGPQIGPRDS